MAKKKEMLDKVLKNLIENNPDIKGALIVSPDGLVIAAKLASLATEIDMVAAMSAAFLGLAKRAVNTLKCGEFKAVVTEGTEMSLRVYHCGEKAVLAIVTTSQANVGFVNLEAREAAQKITQLLAK